MSDEIAKTAISLFFDKSLIILNILFDFIGSKPAVGSSKNRKLGLNAIALAIATLFSFHRKVR